VLFGNYVARPVFHMGAVVYSPVSDSVTSPIDMACLMHGAVEPETFPAALCGTARSPWSRQALVLSASIHQTVCIPSASRIESYSE